MDLRITTWNVNSVRRRLDGVAALVEAHDPDVLCLQETKVADDAFPLDAFAALGYSHSVVNGYKGRNGVAILSRLPLSHRGAREWCDRSDGRHAVAELPGGVEVNNFYVPSGGDVPDPLVNEKFAHKLRFLAEMTNWFAARKAPGNRLVLVGDLNVAPLDSDVWSHAAARASRKPRPEQRRRERIPAGSPVRSPGWSPSWPVPSPPAPRLHQLRRSVSR